MQKGVEIELANQIVIEATPKKFGNSSHVIISRKFDRRKIKAIFGKITNRNKKKIIFDFSNLEILERKVSRFGNSCHIIVPREYSGKKINIILEVEDE